MVTARLPNDELYHELVALAEAGTEVPRLSRIGDCYGPGTIAAAVYAGHRYAREYDVEIDPDKVPFERELHVLTGVL
jgi:dimethylamine/trimethylamine dehydrogenase